MYVLTWSTYLNDDAPLEEIAHSEWQEDFFRGDFAFLRLLDWRHDGDCLFSTETGRDMDIGTYAITHHAIHYG